MAYVLIHRREFGTPTVLKRYSSHGAARCGLRISNRNAGWTRITRSFAGVTELEWCARDNGLPVYNYGPYVIMGEAAYSNIYKIGV
jgi:hypothetical protein